MNWFNHKNLHLYLTAVVVVLVVVAGSFFIVKGASRLGLTLDIEGSSHLGTNSNTTADQTAVAVPIGRVGINNDTPEASLDVGGQVVFGDRSALKIDNDVIKHRELSSSVTGSTYTATGVCACPTEPPISYNNTKSLTQSLLSSAIDVFSVLPANALQQCYSSLETCITAGCSYCVDEGWSCTSPDRQCSGCVVGGTTADATCNAGDSEVPGYRKTGLCNGQPFIAAMRCQTPTTSGNTDYFDKIKFSGSSDGTQPPTVEMFNNLIANDNVPDSCGWETGNKCSSGKFQAGYDNSNDQIWCCEL